MTIRVVLVEDYLPLLDGLKHEINLSEGLVCSGTFEDCETAFAAIGELNPDVVLMDISLPGRDGIECCELLKRKWPLLKVCMYSASEDPKKILRSFAVGADGYILKATPRREIASEIRAAYRGEFPMSNKVRATMAGYFVLRAKIEPTLSPTEKIILDLIEQGKPQKQIADLLKMSLSTAKTHINRILEKFNADSAIEAAARRRRLVC